MDDSDTPSRRTVMLIGSAIVGLFVALVVGSLVVQSLGTINGENEIAAVGQPISVRVDNDLDIRVALTVTALERQVADDEGRDIYLVHYEVSGIDKVAPLTSDRVWRLVDDEGVVHVASDYDLAECPRFSGTTGCAVV